MRFLFFNPNGRGWTLTPLYAREFMGDFERLRAGKQSFCQSITEKASPLLAMRECECVKECVWRYMGEGMMPHLENSSL
ncbi:hypothetical protein QQF64_035680 [Cirrhinus molitorella]|uniref:Uncharacterized protein n=1 Tax=Cirrhinus molitorella TaxID=172907 RepID=A0ABR3NH39_9TELE